MGTSTDGIICMGIFTGEESPFEVCSRTGDLPDADDFIYDAEGWWFAYKGYDGPDDYTAEKEWLEENPMPFEMFNTCSGDYPMWIIAVPGTGITARRGYPEKIGQM